MTSPDDGRFLIGLVKCAHETIKRSLVWVVVLLNQKHFLLCMPINLACCVIVRMQLPCPDVLLTKYCFMIILLFHYFMFYPVNQHSQEVPLHSLAKLTKTLFLYYVYLYLHLESLFYDLPQSKCICVGPGSSKGGLEKFAVFPNEASKSCCWGFAAQSAAQILPLSPKGTNNGILCDAEGFPELPTPFSRQYSSPWGFL